MTQTHKFPYKWRLTDGYPAPGIKYHGCKSFGTFICGGGSSMGYKLAGFNHLGGVEIDPKVAANYKRNLHPQLLYVEDIRQFNERQDLPSDLYDLDLLDGSPPCSTFSTAGSREDAWGKRKQFKEGQQVQTLDDLVFVYCDTIKKLMPKVCLLENVSGLVKGNGKVYYKKIVQKLEKIGYRPQGFLLNAATMGVPQKRERVFIIGLRKDFNLPKLNLDFNEPPILFKDFQQDTGGKVELTDFEYKFWKLRQRGDSSLGNIIWREEQRHSGFNCAIQQGNKVCYTIIASKEQVVYEYPRKMTDYEIMCAGSFPQDYQCDGKIMWYVGMSVPPIMTAQIAHQIYLQWLSKI